VGTTLSSTFLIGLIVAIPGYLFTYDLLKLTGTPADVIDMSAGFARIIFVAIPFVFFVQCLHHIFQRIWRFQYPLLLPGGQYSVKYSVDPCTGHRMGVFSRNGRQRGRPGQCNSYAGCICRFSYLFENSESPLQFDGETARNLRINWPILKLLVGIGIPTSIQMILVSLSAIAVISFINKFGSTATAAFGQSTR